MGIVLVTKCAGEDSAPLLRPDEWAQVSGFRSPGCEAAWKKAAVDSHLVLLQPCSAAAESSGHVAAGESVIRGKKESPLNRTSFYSDLCCVSYK